MPSRWHRIDAVELWHFHTGDPVELQSAPQGEPATWVVLGLDAGAGQVVQAEVPAGWWQRCRCLGDAALVGCTVVPAFLFETFELAPDDWSPPRRR